MAETQLRPKRNKKQIRPPRTMREAFRLGYEYAGGDNFTEGEFLSHNENVMLWEGEMEWFLDREGALQELPVKIHGQVRVRFEYLDIKADK